jgi:hypothetical protein
MGNVNDERNRIWKEAELTWKRWNPDICMEELRKTIENIRRDRQWTDVIRSEQAWIIKYLSDNSVLKFHINAVKAKLSLCLTIKHYAMKTFGGSWCIEPRFLDLGTRWRWVVSFTPRPLYLWGKSHQYPSVRRLGGPQSWSGNMETWKFLPPTGFEFRPLGCLARSRSLYRLGYPGS